ncbi:MAG: hypothetical protein QOI69_2812 [Pseudonocardiales bacterium]|nr:hypothetical protein [Pseudonocardiales bacterium]
MVAHALRTFWGPILPSVIKVVLTHRGAAKAKYGAGGWAKIRQAVTQLAKADKSRGITTRFFAVDSANDATRVGATKIDSPGDSAAIKATIDHIYSAWSPAYLVLLGGPELLSPVTLSNPLWTGNPDDDPDQFVPSDLPYACDAPFSSSPADYRGATRVVGRIPDLIGLADPAVLLTQLAAATVADALIRPHPAPIFAVTAKVWRGSTQLSIGKLPDVSGAVHISPTEGPVWTKSALAAPLHFINCHGSEFDPIWYGQLSPNNWDLPHAVEAARLPGMVAPGTVVAAECCYGTAHWPPAAANGQASVGLSYLLAGAAGVFGASTVAYGPPSANEYADVLCRLFLEEVLGGASLGRAALSARQRFVQGQTYLDPTDLKTLGQFDLLGDPSLQPFVTNGAVPHNAVPPAASPRRAAPKAGRRVPQPTLSAAVLARRTTLSALGDALARSTTASNDTARNRSGLTHARLADLLGEYVPESVRIRTFDSAGGIDTAARAAGAGAALAKGLRPTTHVAFVPATRGRPKAVVVVREHPGGEPTVRVAVPR